MISRLVSLAFLMFFMLPLLVSGQSRVNRQNLTFEGGTDTLTYAKGYALNKATGQWIENWNYIDDHPSNGYSMANTVDQNFAWIKVETIKKDGVKYYVFLWEKFSGAYKYANIREGWEDFRQTHFFILDSLEYNQFKEVVKGKANADVKITSGFFGSISGRYHELGGEHEYSKENLLAKITTVFASPAAEGRCLSLNSQVVDGKAVVRFRLPEYCSESIFKNAYLEVPIEDFSVLTNFEVLVK